MEMRRLSLDTVDLQTAPTIAVLIPCFNEAASIASVIADFREALPGAGIYVHDNNSSDGTAEIAREAGAIVTHEPNQGKGNVVRRMFSDIDADIYILVDGDGTYDAASAGRLVETLRSGPYDMVNAARRHTETDAYRPAHVFGNRMLTGTVGTLFGRKTTDMLSGYKAFSRRFVKTFPALSRNFEIETELMIHALDLRLPITEIEAPYGVRTEGSESKLSTFRDGFRILRLIGWFLRSEKPMTFFSALATVFFLLSIGIGVPVIADYFETGLVPRFPTAILAASIMLLSALSLFTGFILDTVTHGRREAKRLAYLAQQPPPAANRSGAPRDTDQSR